MGIETKGFLKLLENECIKGKRLIPVPHEYAMDIISIINEAQELRQENIMLHEINDQHKELNGELRERIGKAIEYIINDWYELNTVNIENVVDLGKDIRITLFNILKGDSDEK